MSAGQPDFLWANQKRWLHFVEHGYDPETGWKPETLDAEQALRLYKFIEREYGTNAAGMFSGGKYAADSV